MPRANPKLAETVKRLEYLANLVKDGYTIREGRVWFGIFSLTEHPSRGNSDSDGLECLLAVLEVMGLVASEPATPLSSGLRYSISVEALQEIADALDHFDQTLHK